MRRLATLPTAMLAIALASFGESPATAYQVAPPATLPTKAETAKQKAEDGLIDINTADLETLQTLPGIGPVLAREIVAGRPYANITQLSKVSGLGEAKLAELKGKVIARRPRAESAKEEMPKAKAKAKGKAATKDETPAEGGPVDLNSADLETLQTLPGIGPVLAREIVAGRPYANVDDLSKVSGMGPAKLAELRGKVVARRAAPAAPKDEPKAKAEMAKKAATKGEAKAVTTDGPIDLNTAEVAELQTLPGIGPVTARAIVAGRPYASVSELSKVSGMGPAKLAELEGKVVARKPAAVPAPAEKTAAKKAAMPKDEATTATKSAVPKLAPDEKVNLNTATKDKLDALPGIGPVKAQAIIEGRPFKTVEDVMTVKGIKEDTFSKIKEYIIVK
jgi:competence protein ComEA